MYLVQVGYRTISFNHIMLAEDSRFAPRDALPEGVFRVTLEPGRVIDLVGEDADRMRLALGQVSVASPNPPGEEWARIGKTAPPCEEASQEPTAADRE